MELFATVPEQSHAFGSANQTTSEQLAEPATKGKPRRLIVHHAWISWWPGTSGARVLTTGELDSTADAIGLDRDVFQGVLGGRFDLDDRDPLPDGRGSVREEANWNEPTADHRQ